MKELKEIEKGLNLFANEIKIEKAFRDGKISEDLFEKAKSKIFQAKHPGSVWRTINGAKVLIGSGGEVIAGAGGALSKEKKESGGKKGLNELSKEEFHKKATTFRAIERDSDGKPIRKQPQKHKGEYTIQTRIIAQIKGSDLTAEGSSTKNAKDNLRKKIQKESSTSKEKVSEKDYLSQKTTQSGQRGTNKDVIDRMEAGENMLKDLKQGKTLTIDVGGTIGKIQVKHERGKSGVVQGLQMFKNGKKIKDVAMKDNEMENFLSQFAENKGTGKELKKTQNKEKKEPVQKVTKTSKNYDVLKNPPQVGDKVKRIEKHSPGHSSGTEGNVSKVSTSGKTFQLVDDWGGGDKDKWYNVADFKSKGKVKTTITREVNAPTKPDKIKEKIDAVQKQVDKMKDSNKPLSQAVYKVFSEMENKHLELFEKLSKEGKFKTEAGIEKEMKSRFPKEYEKQVVTESQAKQKEEKRVSEGKLTDKQQKAFDSSMKAYNAVSDSEKKNMVAMVQKNVDKAKRGEKLGFGLDKGMLEMGEKFLNEVKGSDKNIGSKLDTVKFKSDNDKKMSMQVLDRSGIKNVKNINRVTEIAEGFTRLTKREKVDLSDVIAGVGLHQRESKGDFKSVKNYIQSNLSSGFNADGGDLINRLKSKLSSIHDFSDVGAKGAKEIKNSLLVMKSNFENLSATEQSGLKYKNIEATQKFLMKKHPVKGRMEKIAKIQGVN